MREDIKFDPQILDFRSLTPLQWGELKQALIAQAHDERNRVLRDKFGVASRWLVRMLVEGEGRAARATSDAIVMIARQWRAYRLARRRRIAVAQLGALDDRTLRDIGLRRGEILAAVYRTDPRRRR